MGQLAQMIGQLLKHLDDAGGLLLPIQQLFGKAQLADDFLGVCNLVALENQLFLFARMQLGRFNLSNLIGQQIDEVFFSRSLRLTCSKRCLTSKIWSYSSR